MGEVPGLTACSGRSVFSDMPMMTKSTPAQVSLVHDCVQVPGTWEMLNNYLIINWMYLGSLDCKTLFRENVLYLSALDINARSENKITVFIVL